MWTFFIAGTLYLIGVGVVLVIRPTYMFTPDGAWKEFGIGQNKEQTTPFPFWLFCLVWALVCYVLVLLLLPYFMNDGGRKPSSRNNSKRNMAELEESSEPADVATELPKGYYVLNRKATKLSGVPKYVYLGEEEPTD